MLHTTSAQILDSVRRNDSSGINPVRIGSITSQTGVQNVAYTVPKGQVLLITQVAAQADIAWGVTSPIPSSPSGLIATGLSIEDGDGTEQGTLGFWHFRRGQTVFNVADTPTWRNAPPGNIVVWKPRYALPVASGWSVNSGPVISAQLGNFLAVYGVLVDEDSARTMGYQVSPSIEDDDRRYGVESLSATGNLVAARAGFHIRVLDVSIRMQADAAGSTVKMTLDQATGSEVLHAVTSNNPADLIEQNFSPSSWYLGLGEGLDATFSVANSGTVSVTYEFVDPEDVPGDVFWGSVSPTLPHPTPTETTGTVIHKGTTIDLYYPRYGTTLTAQTNGSQHWIEGYAISMQKNGAAEPEQTLLALSSGNSEDTINTAFTAGRSNFQLTPVLSCSSHDQNVNIVVDDINLPCVPDVGDIYVDILGTSTGSTPEISSVTPTTSDLDIDEVQVSVWGRTSSSMITTPSNQGG